MAPTSLPDPNLFPEIPLWPKGNPGGWSRPDEEIAEASKFGDFLEMSRVSHPTLRLYRSGIAKPDAPTVLVCPGGGFHILAIEHEGWEVAEFLNRHGIHAAVLKYRLPNAGVDDPVYGPALEDAQEALGQIRSRGIEWGVGQGLVGIMGFSAGGQLSGVTSIADAEPAAKPDFTGLVYAARLEGSSGFAPTVPPAFLVHTADDGVPCQSSLDYASACQKAGVPVELHLYPRGGHGYGLRSKEEGLKTWPDLFVKWIRRLPIG